jgi:RNA polymerase sigma-70 factor, ECF subfamily
MSSVSVMRSHVSAANPQCAASPVREGIINLIPKLRAFSHMLCLEQGLAEALAQKAVVRACHRQSRIDNGANLTTGLFRIYHEEFHLHSRRKAGQAQQNRDVDATPRSPERPKESDSGITTGIAKALGAMSDNQREALILISAGGFTCEDAAKICGTQPRTMKSRAVRARRALMKTLDSDREFSKSDGVRELWASSAI